MSKKQVNIGGYKEFVEVCDKCGEQSKTSSNDFKELNRINKSVGWQNKLIDGEWKAFCPRCKGKTYEMPKGSE